MADKSTYKLYIGGGWCCEECSESWSYVRIYKDKKIIYESSWYTEGELYVDGGRTEVRKEVSLLNLKFDLSSDNIDDWEGEYVE